MPSLSSAIFAGLTEILEEVDSAEPIGKSSIRDSWNLWETFNPLSKGPSENTQDAIMAYLRLSPQIYRLMDRDTRNELAVSVLDVGGFEPAFFPYQVP